MSEPVYIYAFCDGQCEAVPVEGLCGASIRFVSFGDVSAAVSSAPGGRLRPQRRLLSAHQAVLSWLADRIPTLPAAFGLVAESVPVLERAVRDHAESIRAELDRVGRCVEIDLRLAWDTENVFEHVVSIDDGLRELRDRLVAMGDAAPHELRVSVGRRVERVLAAHRDDAGQRLIDAIAPVCSEIEMVDPGSESELVRLSVLVAREERDALERRVVEAARQFDDAHVVRLSGPFAPHSFVDLHLDLSNSRLAA